MEFRGGGSAPRRRLPAARATTAQPVAATASAAPRAAPCPASATEGGAPRGRRRRGRSRDAPAALLPPNPVRPLPAGPHRPISQMRKPRRGLGSERGSEGRARFSRLLLPGFSPRTALYGIQALPYAAAAACGVLPARTALCGSLRCSFCRNG